MNLTELSPSTVKKAVELCMRARVVPFIVGSPGCGKSQIVKEIANDTAQINLRQFQFHRNIGVRFDLYVL